MDTNKVAGCLYGAAIGDAVAAPVEFLHGIDQIEGYYATHSFGTPTRSDILYVTDDTQMMLAVGEALQQVVGAYTAANVEEPLRRAFVTWMHSPDNNRAPGMTCMSACRQLETGLAWTKATVIGSKGCGANMRVQPVGLLFGESAETRAGLAQFQAALTHGHPTALAASDLTAWAIHDLAMGGEPGTLPDRLIDYAESQRQIYHGDWLGDLWQRGDYSSGVRYMGHGWDECINVLHTLKKAVASGDRGTDPCKLTGEGWIAEEAFAAGLLSFLWFTDNPVEALRRASVTSGDSDSIACLAGAFVGAHHGIDAFPREWREQIEYKDRIDALAAFLS